MKIAMPFHPSVTTFTLGNHRARLLRILPNDPWLGLIEFDCAERQWINAALLAEIGWTPLGR
jgi:hypothetical protein